MPRLRLRTVLACLAVFCATPALARVEVHSLQHKSMGRVLTVRVSEEIAPGDYETLLKGLRNNPGTYSRKLLLLNSIGGSVPEAIRMGRLLRESGFDALVPSSSVCQGTCVYLLRFLLGVAEAGFFPGILVYLNRWFPARRRGQITALFAIAVPMAGVIGGPLSGWILEGFHDALGLRGWQWMFLIEGLPVVLLGVVVWCSLPESFERVTWLSDEQKHLLREELAGEEQRKTITSFSGIFSNPQVWLLVAIYFAVMLAVNTIAFWMPSLIHGAGIAQDSRIGMLSAVPYLAGCAFMIFIGRSSDRLRERRWHLGIPLLMAAAGLSLAALAPTSAWLVMGGLVIAGMGASAALPMFWQLPPAFLSSATLAAGIALISSFGSIAAFLAPYLIGWMRDTTQSASLALYLLAILIALGAGLVLRTPAAVVNPR